MMETIVCDLKNDGLGCALIRIRKQLKITQRELARRMGINESVISRNEKKLYRGCSIGKLDRIVGALGCTIKIQIITDWGE